MIQAVRAIVTNGNHMLVMKRNKFGKQYYTLVGGGIEMGEEAEKALRREIKEETSLEVGRVQLVYVEDAESPYGTQYVYWCEYQGGDPVLSSSATEFEITKAGQNTYEPVWLSIAELSNVPFVSTSLKAALIEAFTHGFPSEAKQITWRQ